MQAWLYTIVFGTVLIVGFGAQAGTLVGVGQDPPPPMGPFEGNDQSEDMIMVGSPTNPVPITLDPTGPAWMKQFVINRDGQGWSTDGPLSMVSVMEFITFPPGSTPGTTLLPVDWHEDIDATVGDGANFKWAGGHIETPFGSFPGMTSTDGKSIWFDFPRIPPGLPIKITKQLMWAGSGPITPGPNGSNNYLIKINERPSVPEPSSMLLASLGLAIAAGSARKFGQ